jgi:pyrimidine-nucleoside phosphorylase
LSVIPGLKLDKHSSGGVGDKVTLAFVPILAAAGIKVAKMSGHGLGHTGGTLDKLESIPGFRTELTESEILAQVQKIGACICAQTKDIAPADKAIYALRDVTGTVASIPLIASSIMSKKIACGADVILLDIKVGAGAFMKTIDQARELASMCVKIGQSYGKRIVALLTDMNQPLGRAVGNAIEVNEARDLLAGNDTDGRFWDETMALSNEALKLAGCNRKTEEIVSSGDALKKFDEIVAAQSGHFDPDLLKSARSLDLISVKSGYVTSLDALSVGNAAALLGAGRQTKNDTIDYLAGIWLSKIQGEKVERGEPLATLYASDQNRLSSETLSALLSAYQIGDEPAEDEANPILARIG